VDVEVYWSIVETTVLMFDSVVCVV